jgi:3-deoxy-7-phosphoheptulonate synthase
MGHAYGIADLARACTAMGIDGLLIETHPQPNMAQSDAPQQLDHQQFANMYVSLKQVANSVGKILV